MTLSEFEFSILDKLGIFSVWYIGARSYIPFLTLFSVALICARFIGRRDDAISRVPRAVAIITYSAVAASVTAVALWDVAVTLFVKRSFAEDDVFGRLKFLARPEILAVENLVGFLVLLMVPIALLSRKKHRNLLSEIFARPRTRLWKTLLLSLSCTALILGMGALVVLYPYVQGPSAGRRGVTAGLSILSISRDLAEISTVMAAAAAGMLVTLVATSEELLFRGVIYSGLRKEFGVAGALIVESGMFSTYHSTRIGTPDMLYIFIAGMGLTWLYEQTGSIYLPIAVHGTLLGVAVLAGFAFRG